jgi:hypothetical protein
MENNNYNNPFSAENAEDHDHVEAPAVEVAVETTVEPVVETVVEAVVEAPAAVEPVQALGFTETGAIGSMAADGASKEINTDVNLSGKVALFSTKSVRWEEVGTLNRGYNIVTEKQADKWLTRSHVRIATPEEIQKAFG